MELAGARTGDLLRAIRTKRYGLRRERLDQGIRGGFRSVEFSQFGRPVSRWMVGRRVPTPPDKGPVFLFPGRPVLFLTLAWLNQFGSADR